MKFFCMDQIFAMQVIAKMHIYKDRILYADRVDWKDVRVVPVDIWCGRVYFKALLLFCKDASAS